MKPLKSGLAFSNWLMRIALIVFVLSMLLGSVKMFNYTEKSFYIVAGFVLFGILLFIGGFTSKPILTVVSGFVLSGLSIYKIIVLFSGTFNPDIASYMIILAIGFYFVCAGNQG
jgi:hypothetical protein